MAALGFFFVDVEGAPSAAWAAGGPTGGAAALLGWVPAALAETAGAFTAPFELRATGFAPAFPGAGFALLLCADFDAE